MARADIELFPEAGDAPAEPWERLAADAEQLLECIRREAAAVEAWVRLYEARGDPAAGVERERLRRWRAQETRHGALLERFRAAAAAES